VSIKIDLVNFFAETLFKDGYPVKKLTVIKSNKVIKAILNNVLFILFFTIGLSVVVEIATSPKGAKIFIMDNGLKSCS